MTYRNAREGVPAQVRGRELEFSFWPVQKTTRRYGLGSRLFTTDAWPVIRGAISTAPTRRMSKQARELALAFVAQAEAYFRAATSVGFGAAKPVLLYYSFLNLAKALVLHQGGRAELPRAYHGLSEKLATGGKELVDAYLVAFPASDDTCSVFDLLLRAVRHKGITKKQQFELVDLLPQVVPGHRLWASAASENERFVSIRDIRIVQSKDAKEVWLQLEMCLEDLPRLGLTAAKLLMNSGLSEVLRRVKSDYDSSLVCESRDVMAYSARPSDVVLGLVRTIDQHVWTTVTTSKPYRSHYLYCPSSRPRVGRLPQLGAIYAIAFYLGSVTRYRPQQFDALLQTEFGPFIESFMNDQPNQFLYLIASEFCARDVTRAPLV